VLAPGLAAKATPHKRIAMAAIRKRFAENMDEPLGTESLH
jgi:hypothetical protein